MPRDYKTKRVADLANKSAGSTASPTFVSVTVTDLDGSRIVYSDSGSTLASTQYMQHNDTTHVTRLGDVANSDYMEVEADGTVEFLGDATVYDDIRINVGNISRPGGSDPAWVSLFPAGGGLSTYFLEFSINNYGTFTVQIPHGYKEGSDIRMHIHWTPGNRGNEENGKKVGWKVDYAWASIDGVFGAMQTADCQDACNGVDWEHNMTPEVTVSGAGKTISSMLVCNIRRSDTGTDDTWVSAASGQLPLLLEVDFHYEIDMVGSRSWGTK